MESIDGGGIPGAVGGGGDEGKTMSSSHDDCTGASLVPSTGALGGKFIDGSGSILPDCAGSSPPERDGSPDGVMDVLDKTSGSPDSDGGAAPERVPSSSDAPVSGDAPAPARAPRATRARAAARPQRYREHHQATTAEAQAAAAASSSSPAPAAKKKAPTAAAVSGQRKKNAHDDNDDDESAAAPKKKRLSAQGGTWTEREQRQFLDGICLHGWGNWAAIERGIPTRTRNQVKSHAQKYQKHHPEEKSRLQREFQMKQEQPPPTKKTQKQKQPPPTTTTTKQEQKQQVTTTKTKRVAKKSELMTPPVELPVARSARASRAEPNADAGKKRAESRKRKSPAAAAAIPADPVPEPESEPKAWKRSRPAGRRAETAAAANPRDDVEAAADLRKSRATSNKARTASPAAEVAGATRGTKAAAAGLEKPRAKRKPEPSSSIVTRKRAPPARTKAPAMVAENDSPGKRRVLPPVPPAAATVAADVPKNSGEWSELERAQFEKGCMLHGWGNWVAIEPCVPTRTTVQIKSHAQKYRKHHPDKVDMLREEHLRLAAGGGKVRGKRLADDCPQGDVKKSKSIKMEGSKSAVDKGTGRGASWSLTEQRQFEEGVVFHGWGNWTEVATHVLTKTSRQVRMHASSYNSGAADDRKQLEREHTRHYQDNLKSEETGKTRAFSPNHILLGTGGMPRTSRKAKDRAPLSRTSSRKMALDDHSAAEAIMALNFSSWGAGKDDAASGTESADETSAVTSSEGDDEAALKAQDGGDASVDLQSSEEEGSEEGSRMDSRQFEETGPQTTVDANPSVDSHDPDTLSESEVEAVEATLEPCARTAILQGKGDVNSYSAAANSSDEAAEAQGAPARPNTSSQPPPHWLAADTWDQCMDNIYRWNSQLSREEQNAEEERYDDFSAKEKERLRRKLVNLMNNRPPALHVSE